MVGFECHKIGTIIPGAHYRANKYDSQLKRRAGLFLAQLGEEAVTLTLARNQAQNLGVAGVRQTPVENISCAKIVSTSRK